MPVQETAPQKAPVDHDRPLPRIPALSGADPTLRGPKGKPTDGFRLFVLAALLGLPVFASDGVRADDGQSTGPETFHGLGLRSEAMPASSFGFEGSVCGSGAGTWAVSGEPSPTRFSICPESLATHPRERPVVQWALPLEPPFRRPPAPGAPLHGVRNDLAPYGTKFLRSTLILTGTALASGVVLAVLPRQFTKWDDDAYQRGSSNFRRAWTQLPVWDGDVAFHNWLGHPYAGAMYYNMIRSQGGTVRQSFAFAVFQSVMWEYLFEAIAEQPSIQDLITTPIMGAVLGELFNRWTVAILRQGRLNFGEKVLVFFLNPSYVINNGYRPPE